MCAHPPDLPISDKSHYKKKIDLTEVPAKMVPSTIHAKCSPFNIDAYGEGSHVLYFLPEASVELDCYVQYGKKRATNAYEQQFIGLGHNFIDSNHRIQTVVARIIPILSASRGPTHAQVISENNDAMLGLLENERRIQNKLESKYNIDENGYSIDPFLEHGPSKVVLFGHTHPGLGCSFSSVDHRSNYSTPSAPIVTFVCDPIRKDMKAMVGVNCEEVKIIVCRPKSLNPTASSLYTAVPQNLTVENLRQRVSELASSLLQQAGVIGNFSCHHDWRGRTHMQFKIKYCPLKQVHKD